MEFDANEQQVRERGDFRVEGTGSQNAPLRWLSGLRERARDSGGLTQRRAAEARVAAGGYVRRHPWGMVAAAFVVGFAAGVWVGRR